jgi:3-oxoadipate enol-lactonase
MDRLATADGTTTALRGGSGPDLLIVHSLLTDRDAFQAVLPDLVERFRVTLLNLPGFHGSRPIPGTLTAYVTWLANACDAFGIGSDCIVCGNGFGGTVALAFALNYQHRIRKLLLADVAAAFPEQGKAAFRTMAEKVAQEGMASIAPIAASRVYHSDYLTQHPAVIEERRRVLAAIDPVAFTAACEFLIDCDLVPRLASLRLPTLVVYGELDQATPPALNEIIAAKIPACEILKITNCGHCPPLENPGAFLRSISRFISS